METVPHSSDKDVPGRRTKPIVRVRARASGESATATAKPRRSRRNRRRTSGHAPVHQRSTTTNDSVPPLPDDPPAAPVWFAIARGVALFLGLLTLINLCSELSQSHADAEFWWINLNQWPDPVARGFLGTVTVLLFLFASQANTSRLVRYLTMLGILTLLAMGLKNTYSFYSQVQSGVIESWAPLPMSVYSLILLNAVFCGVLLEPRREAAPLRTMFLGSFTFLICVVGFPVMQMFGSGLTDWHRDAQVVVVISEPSPRDELKPNEKLNPINRKSVEKAAELFQNQRINQIVFLYQPGKADNSQIAAMKQLALGLGVPEKEIIVIQQNDTSDKEMIQIAESMKKDDWQQALVVGQFYRLPRMQLLLEQAGCVASGVPVNAERITKVKPAAVVNEAILLWQAYGQAVFIK